MFRRRALLVKKTNLFPQKSRLGTLAALRKDQTDRTAGTVPQKAQAFWFHTLVGSAGEKLSHALRTVYYEKVASVLQRPGGRLAQLIQCQKIFPAGSGHRQTGGAGRKIRRVGNTYAETSGGKETVCIRNVGAYTLHTGR